MALTATIYHLDIDLADSDRGRYESLTLRVAQHPSESVEYLIARVLAYCLEFDGGIAFSSGVSDPDHPTISVRDLTGALRVWVEIGLPDAARLHKARKAADRVVVYTHRDPDQWYRVVRHERIHRAETIEICALAPAFVADIARRLDRRTTLAVSRADGHVSVAIGDAFIECPLVPTALGSIQA